MTVNEEYFRPEQAGPQDSAATRGGLANAAEVQEPVAKRLA